MGRHRLQILFNHLEREFAAAGELFLTADKMRHTAQDAFEKILEVVAMARVKLQRQPHAPSLRRLDRIETLTRKLLLNYATERRTIDALGFLLGRLEKNLASEMLEPRIYSKIREAVMTESVITKDPIKPPTVAQKSIRLMLIGKNDLHYAIPVQKIMRKSATEITYMDAKGKHATRACDEIFKAVEMSLRTLKQRVEYVASGTAADAMHRPYLKFYGRHFFLYGARLNYTVRTGGRERTQAPER